jgi:hypothetical protein
MTSAGSELLEPLLLVVESTDARRGLLLRRVLFLLRTLFLRPDSSSEDTSYKSSNSVASVVKLSLVHGAEEGEGEILSASEAVDDGGIGADMK